MTTTIRAAGTPVSGAARNASRRIVLELVVVAVLAGIGAQFPRGVDPDTAWSFLATHWSALAHALLGALVLAEAVAFLLRLGRASPTPLKVLGGTGLACIAVSAASGVAYLALGQPDSALVWMTLGWLGGLTTYSISWFHSRRKRLSND